MNLKTLGLVPILIPQALWVMARASRLPEASGDRHGALGTGTPLRLLVIGDSSAAGVGVSHQRDALSGQLAKALSAHGPVTWQTEAQSGATVASTLNRLDGMPPQQADLVLIALGVNDTKNGVSAKAWETGYRRLLSHVSDACGASRICVSGMPPVRHFPLLPYPLNAVLGARAEQFDAILRDLADERPNTRHLPLDFSLDPANMAEDGFHPSAKIYEEWAQRAAAMFLDAG